MSTVALQSDIATRWISANGTLANLLFGAIFWLVLLKPRRYRPATRYFLVLALAGNLFTGAGYFLFSGAINFGDWAEVIGGLQPHWMWRIGLVVLGSASYYASMLVVAAQMKPFQSDAWVPEGFVCSAGRHTSQTGFSLASEGYSILSDCSTS